MELNQVLWHMLLIQELGRQKQADFFELKISQVYIPIFRPVGDTRETLSQNKMKQTKEKHKMPNHTK